MPETNLTGGTYIPYEQRCGNESIVYFTRDLSPEGLKKAFPQVARPGKK